MKTDCDDFIRILLVDDKAIIREGLAAVLTRESDMQIVAEAENGEEAIKQFCGHLPSLTLMDISMPVMDGLAATRAIVQEFPAARILVLSNNADAEAESLKAGTAAFLSKDVGTPHLIDTIRALAGRLPSPVFVV